MKRKLLFSTMFAAMLSIGIIAGGCQTSKAAPSKPAPKAEMPAPTSYSSGDTAYFPTGVASSSVLKVTRSTPSQVGVNEDFSYTITATNLSNTLALNDVVLNETVEGALQVASSDPEAQKTGNGYSWNLGTLMPGQSKTITVNAKATDVGDITRCVNAAFVPVVCVVTNVVKPGLTLEKTGPAEVLKCDPIEYRFTVRNPGSGPANNVVIKDTLPEGLVTASGGVRDVNINVGTLAPGEAKAYSLAVRANGTGTFSNTATASASAGLQATDGHQIIVKAPVLEVTGKSPELRYLERTACHEYTVTNSGDGVAKNATLTIAAQGGTFQRATANATPTGNTVKYSLGDLAPGASKTIEVCYSRTEIGKVTTTATAEAYCADNVVKTEETEFKGIAALLLEVVDSDDPVELGNETTYVITVTNQGSATATNVTITANLDDGMNFVSGAGATRTTAEGDKVTFAPLAELAPKASATWRIVAKARTSGDKRTAVEMNADQLDTPVNETESTNLYE